MSFLMTRDAHVFMKTFRPNCVLRTIIVKTCESLISGKGIRVIGLFMQTGGLSYSAIKCCDTARFLALGPWAPVLTEKRPYCTTGGLDRHCGWCLVMIDTALLESRLPLPLTASHQGLTTQVPSPFICCCAVRLFLAPPPPPPATHSWASSRWCDQVQGEETRELWVYTHCTHVLSFPLSAGSSYVAACYPIIEHRERERGKREEGNFTNKHLRCAVSGGRNAHAPTTLSPRQREQREGELH